jgi:hypothetical protein
MYMSRLIQALGFVLAGCVLYQNQLSIAGPPKDLVEHNRRWFDDHLNRTTLPASFGNPDGRPCFAVAGLFAVNGGRVEIMFPQAVAHNGMLGDRNEYAMDVTLADETCKIKINVSKEVLDNGKWRSLKTRRSF